MATPNTKSKKSKQTKIRLNDVRASFLYVFQPQEMEDDSGKTTKSYSGHFLLAKDHPQFNELRKAMLEVAKSTYGEKNGLAMFKQLTLKDRTCLRKGETKTDADGEPMDGYEGMYFVSARSKVKPRTIDRDRSELTEKSNKLYSGCHVNVVLALWGQTGKFGKRINAQLMGVQFLRDDEAFSSGRAASVDDFDELENEFQDDDIMDADDDLDDDDLA